MGFLRGEICYPAKVSGCACWRRLDEVNYCGQRRGEEGTSLLNVFPVCIEGGDDTHFLFCIENGVRRGVERSTEFPLFCTEDGKIAPFFCIEDGACGVDLVNEVDFADLYFPLLYGGRKHQPLSLY
jgi:hypothetical protein